MSESIKLVNGSVKEFAEMECTFFEENLGDLDLNEVWNSIEWKTSIAKGHVYGGGRDPVATQRGRRENSVKIKMALEGWEMIKSKLYEKELDPLLVKFDITVAHAEREEITRVTRLKQVEFKEDIFSSEGGKTDGNFIELEGIFPGKPEDEF